MARNSRTVTKSGKRPSRVKRPRLSALDKKIMALQPLWLPSTRITGTNEMRHASSRRLSKTSIIYRIHHLVSYQDMDVEMKNMTEWRRLMEEREAQMVAAKVKAESAATGASESADAVMTDVQEITSANALRSEQENSSAAMTDLKEETDSNATISHDKEASETHAPAAMEDVSTTSAPEESCSPNTTMQDSTNPSDKSLRIETTPSTTTNLQTDDDSPVSQCAPSSDSSYPTERDYIVSKSTGSILENWPSDVPYQFSRFIFENDMAVEFVPEGHFLRDVQLKNSTDIQRRVVWRGAQILPIGTCLGEYRGVFQELPKLNFSGYSWKVSEDTHVDAKDQGSYLRFVNHYENISARPNCKGVTNREEGTEVRRVYFVCTKDIYPGDELLIDYGVKAHDGKMDCLQCGPEDIRQLVEAAKESGVESNTVSDTSVAQEVVGPS